MVLGRIGTSTFVLLLASNAPSQFFSLSLSQDISCSTRGCAASATFSGYYDFSASTLSITNLNGDFKSSNEYANVIVNGIDTSIDCSTGDDCDRITTCLSNFDISSYLSSSSSLTVTLASSSNVDACTPYMSATITVMNVVNLSPTLGPTPLPTLLPTMVPSAPTDAPSPMPSSVPTLLPTLIPTTIPSAPTDAPSPAPTKVPTPAPSERPSRLPTPVPSNVPTPAPSELPSRLPTLVPSSVPTPKPSEPPSRLPTREPSARPACLPSSLPTREPSPVPSLKPTRSPSALPTLNLAPNGLFSANGVESASTNPLVVGGIFVLCAAVAILICRTVYKKSEAGNNHGGDKEVSNVTAAALDETALFAQLHMANDSSLDDAGIEEIDLDVEFEEDEETARAPEIMNRESSAVSELETMAQKHAEEIELVKLSTEAKMKIRQRKIDRLETAAEKEAAKVADLAAKLERAEREAEANAANLVESAQSQEYLQAKVAELTEELGRLQEKSKTSTDDATIEVDDSHLPTPSSHDKHATTAIPTDLLKDLIEDSAAPESMEGGDACEDDPHARVMKAGESVGGAGNVRVAVRVRPPNQRELAVEGNGLCVDVFPADGIVKVDSDKAFTFDMAFSMEATQAQVFDKLGVDLVGWVLGGFNASVFAYGQTSSGKTHSMMGARDSEVLQGLIPRVISLLWECVQAFLDENSKHDCVLKASYLEIYNEEIRDLLGNCEKLKLRNDPKKGIFATGLTMVPLQSGDGAMECIERGAQLRSVAATKVNSESSRSHAVFELHISKTYPKESGDMVSSSRLSLTDLAGSERSSKVV